MPADAEYERKATPAQPPSGAPAGPTPAEELANQISLLQGRINSLQSGVLLASLKDELENLDTQVNALEGKVSAVRTAGYVFEVDLEKKAQSLREQWAPLRSNAQGQITQQVPVLQRALQQVEGQHRTLLARQADVNSARPMAASLENEVSGVEAKVSAARQAVEGSYDQFQKEAQTFQAHLEQSQAMMKQAAEATFPWLPTEGLIALVEAKWQREGKDGPKGVLYLTDQRLLFEQKEEVATKKILFIATAKEKVQKLLLEAPVADVEQVKASKQGLMSHEDHIDLTFGSSAPLRYAHFHLDGQDCNLWQGLIGRAKARDFDKDRAVKVDQAVVEKVANAPTKCPNCGGAFTKPVLRGQTEIKCEYCGAVTRL